MLTGEKLYFNSQTECAKYFGVTRRAIARYLQTDNIKKTDKYKHTLEYWEELQN